MPQPNWTLVIHGGGEQTRSFTYVEDFVQGLLRLAAAPPGGLLRESPVVNLGNPEEKTVRQIAEACWRAVHGSASEPRLQVGPKNPGDPARRCPDITRARAWLDWRPQTSLDEGLQKSLPWFRRELGL